MTATATRPVPAPTVTRRARLATTGGALWLLSALPWTVTAEEQQYGSLAFVAVAVVGWLFFVLPPLLLVPGHLALRAAMDPAAGRLGRVGIPVAAAGLTAMSLGIGIELASISAGGGEVALGHAILLVGFLVSIVGALLTGIAVVRRRRDAASRAAGWLLVLALPLGIGIGALGPVVAPGNDAFFWAALTIPTGAAWLLLGRSLATKDAVIA